MSLVKKKFNRMTAFMLIIIFIFAILIFRLIYLQILSGEYYRGLAESIAERSITQIGARGDILDRNGKKLATNRVSYNITYSYTGEDTGDINSCLIEFLSIIYKSGEQEKLNINTFPIEYDSSKNVFSYKFLTDDRFEIVKQAKNIKKQNNIVTTFDKNFDYKLLNEFEDKLENIEDSAARDEATKDFIEKHLKTFNENMDARETFYLIAEKYKLVSLDSSANAINNYGQQLDTTDKLLKTAALRYVLKDLVYKQYEKVDIAKDVKKETAWEIQIKGGELEAINEEVVPIRYYPNDEVGSAFLGYLGKISNAEKYKRLGYDIKDELIGVSGLEYVLENNQNNSYGIQLRGEPSIDYVKVDNYGKPISQAAKLEAIPGDTVRTTINVDIQAAAEKALDETMAKIRDGGFGQKYRATRGAVVAMDIDTGEILALASRPGFDPNYFAENGVPQDTVIIQKYLLDNPKILSDDKYDLIARPLFNYATQGAVMPGSTFKPFTAIAGLEAGVINKNTTIYDDGIWNNLPGIHIKEWTYNSTGRGFGSVNVEEALKLSSNYFFNEVGYKLGFEKFSEWADKFGLVRGENGEKPSTGVEIPENPGSVGTPEESRRRAASSAMKDIAETLKDYRYGGFTLDDGTVYYSEIYEMLVNANYDEKKLEELGIHNEKAQRFIKNKINFIKKFAVNKIDVLNMAMGQGYVSLTPVQMAQYLSTILNGGTRYKAHLIKQVLNPDGTVKEEIEPEILNKINLNPENVEIIKEGMGKVTDETGGTASSIFRNYPIKTGGKTGTAEPGTGDITNYRDNYGWFVSFAPFDKPEIVVAVVIYDGGHGIYSANIAKAIFNEYFKDQPQMKEYLAKIAQNKK